MSQALKTQVVLATCFLSLVAFSVHAAEISFAAQSRETSAGRQLQVDLLLNTGGEEVNALEGKLLYPAGLLELKETRDANSIVNFWIERPKAERDGAIVFSGITPGGYKGSRGLVFSVVFQAKKAGEGVISFEGARVLKNDSYGTPTKLSVSDFQVSVTEAGPLKESQLPAVEDKESPESFLPEIGRDPALSDGKWFLVFATQDKGRGIERYELKEARYGIFAALSGWRTAESPYVLSDQKLQSYIYVRAVDKSGNARIAVIPPKQPLPWYKSPLVWVIIILAAAGAYFLRWKK